MPFRLFGRKEPQATLFIEPKTPEAQAFARYMLRDNKSLRKAFEEAFGAKTKLNDDASKIEISAAPGRHEQIQLGYKHLKRLFEQAKSDVTDLDIRWTARLLKYANVNVVFAGGSTDERSLEEKFTAVLKHDEDAMTALGDIVTKKYGPKPKPDTP